MTNKTLFQFFHWYYSAEGDLWRHIKDRAPHVASLGVTDAWLPPAYKGSKGLGGPGYAVYDLYDLGEFDQKLTVRTKHGTKEEYLEAIQALHDNGIGNIADIVLNHKHGGDEVEKVMAQQVDSNNRLEKIGEPVEIEAYTKFTFPGCQGKYSDFIWDHQCFTGFDCDSNIYIILNQYTNGEWEPVPETEMGNFDFLLGVDIDFRNPAVTEELKHWIDWYMDAAPIDGLRLDAVKHMPAHFYNTWPDHVRARRGSDFFVVGEYWKRDVAPLLSYIDMTEGRMQLFDAPLHYNFYNASHAQNNYDMSKIFEGSLVQARPDLAITFVDNHDTQPFQSLEAPVEPWFQPHAYALILLREQGIPMVFYPAVFDAQYVDDESGGEHYAEMKAVPGVESMMKTRHRLAYGVQRDYLDHQNTIGWTREGDDEHEHSGCAVVLTNGSSGTKVMEMGPRHIGGTFVDITGGREEKIMIDENGWAEFPVNDGVVSVWIREEAAQL